MIRMKNVTCSAVAALTLAVPVGARAQDAAPAAAPAPTVFRFDADAEGRAPSGFTFGRTGSGRLGAWIVRKETDAGSAGNVLAQVDTDPTDNRFPIAVADRPELQDLALEVKCKPVSGKVDQACGLVFRYRDPDNYYITRANPLENNVRIYYVKNGQRTQLASWSGKVLPGVWSKLRVEVRADRLEVFWNGARVLQASDKTFTGAGKVGVWTKADSVTLFDDLTVTPLGVP